jgi:hypothetical protein
MLGHNYNRKLGFYQWNTQEYAFAMEAILDASRQPSSSDFVSWNFNNDDFAKIRWQQEPAESLQQCYVERARQLREKYDWLILSYSGGSDSWTILNTFLSNGIKIDEIAILTTSKATDNLNVNPLDYNYTSVWQEYHLVVKRDLQWLATHHPEIKITLSDFTDRSKFEFKDAWQEKSSVQIMGSVTNKFYAPNITDTINQQKNIGWIVGVDKPRICVRDGKYCMYFLDFISHVAWSGDADYLDGFWTPELFYWAPESEKIMRKQAHTIKRFFQNNPQFLPYITWPLPPNPKYTTIYESLIKALIYPDYDLTKWQADKSPAGRLYMGYETPIWWSFPEIKEHYFGGRKEALTQVDSRYLHNNGESVKGFISPFYEI